MSDLSLTLSLCAVIGLWIVLRVVPPRLDRDRIRESVEKQDGKVIEIVPLWGSRSRSNRVYEVSYVTAGGERVKAKCRTSLWNGVTWTSDRSPRFVPDDDGPNVL